MIASIIYSVLYAGLVAALTLTIFLQHLIRGQFTLALQAVYVEVCDWWRGPSPIRTSAQFTFNLFRMAMKAAGSALVRGQFVAVMRVLWLGAVMWLESEFAKFKLYAGCLRHWKLTSDSTSRMIR